MAFKSIRGTVFPFAALPFPFSFFNSGIPEKADNPFFSSVCQPKNKGLWATLFLNLDKVNVLFNASFDFILRDFGIFFLSTRLLIISIRLLKGRSKDKSWRVLSLESF